MITVIAAIAKNNALGKDNQLIWYLPADLKLFKKVTLGHHIIMGRKTFESFPKPLPNRTHVVITKQEDYKVPHGIIVVNSLKDALDVAKEDNQPFIIGGGEIYKQSLEVADKIYLTLVHQEFEGDTQFPELNSEWAKMDRKDFSADEKNQYDYSF